MVNKSKKILAEISAGELLDKITILEIKKEKIKNKDKLDIVNKEYSTLNDSLKKNLNINTEIKELWSELKIVNTQLWDIEDAKRLSEKNKKFGDEFIELARNVYKFNDRRAKIKSKINQLTGSNIKEVKQYTEY